MSAALRPALVARPAQRPPVAPGVQDAIARAAKRASSSGGVMFVVAITLTVLAALGAWALQSAALEVRMAGYERQNTQTHYMSEYGILAAMQTLDPMHAAAILPAAITGANGVRPGCISAPTQYDSNATCIAKACWVWLNAQSTVNEYNSSYSAPASFQPYSVPSTPPYAIDPSSTSTSGSLGYSAVQGDFNVELTEPVQASTSQVGNGGQAFYWVTLTSFGQTGLTSGGVDAGAGAYSQGNETLRTRVLVGPVPPINVTTCN